MIKHLLRAIHTCFWYVFDTSKPPLSTMHALPRPQHSALLGFSLLEVSIVLALMGILGGYSIHYLAFSSRTFQLPTHTQRLLQDLQFVQHNALTLQTTLRVVFYKHGYHVTDLDGQPMMGHFRQKRATFTLPDSIQLSSPLSYLLFNSQGRPLRHHDTPLKHPLFLLISEDDQQRTLVIDPITGYMHIQ